MNIHNRSYLNTEQTHPSSSHLDELSTDELVKLFSHEDLMPQKAVSKAIPSLIEAIDKIYLRMNANGRLFYIGAGTSGRLGVLDAAECPPTFCSSPELIQAVIAGGDSAIKISSESSFFP